MTFLYIIAAVLLFGILITVHEAGHFMAARWMKIPVREFAIGFGPKLLKWKSRKYETEFYLRAIPLGGYCAFYGEDDTTGEFKDDPRSFNRFSVGKRLLTIIMGPLMNLALAIVVAVVMYALTGVPVADGDMITLVRSVNKGSVAEHAGLLPNDMLLSVDGQKVVDGNLPELFAQDTTGKERSLQIIRMVDGKETEITIPITPLFDPVEQRNMIGIGMSIAQPLKYVKGSFGDIINNALELSYRAGTMVINAVVNLVTRGEGAGEVAGVVGITKMIVDEIQQTQLQGYLYLMVVISINLGLMNLLTIPGLDGSRIVFLLIEAVRGKPIKKEAYVHTAGMLLLFALMIFITFRDIIRLF